MLISIIYYYLCRRNQTTMRKIILTISLITLLACSGNTQKNAADNAKIGKYVYIDEAKVLHTKNGCKAVYKDHSMQRVNPVEPLCLSFESLGRLCSQCVSEQQIDSLSRLFESYRQSYTNVGELYEYLDSIYSDIPDDELTFRENMRSPEVARQLYHVLKDGGADVGTIDEFFQWIGLGKPAKKENRILGLSSNSRNFPEKFG